MPTKRNRQINLLPRDDFESSSFGRVLKWALSTFRALVIVTELIVMSAFLSRFWLDAKNSDLGEQVKIASAQVNAYKKVEDEFRLLQKKLSVTKSFYILPKESDFLNKLAAVMPSDVFLSSFSIGDDGVQIKAYSSNEQSIAQFLVNIENGKLLTSPILTQVSSSADNPLVTLFTVKGGRSL